MMSLTQAPLGILSGIVETSTFAEVKDRALRYLQAAFLFGLGQVTKVDGSRLYTPPSSCPDPV